LLPSADAKIFLITYLTIWLSAQYLLTIFSILGLSKLIECLTFIVINSFFSITKKCFIIFSIYFISYFSKISAITKFPFLDITDCTPLKMALRLEKQWRLSIHVIKSYFMSLSKFIPLKHSASPYFCHYYRTNIIEKYFT